MRCKRIVLTGYGGASPSWGTIYGHESKVVEVSPCHGEISSRCESGRARHFVLICVTSIQKGKIATLQVELRAAEKGYVVSWPTTSARYDLVIDTGKVLLRTQVKYADGLSSHSEGAVTVSLRRFQHDNKYNRKPIKPKFYSASEVDLVLVYIPKTDQIVAFKPLIFAGKGALTIRLKPPKNRQQAGVLFARNFLW